MLWHASEAALEQTSSTRTLPDRDFSTLKFNTTLLMLLSYVRLESPHSECRFMSQGNALCSFGRGFLEVIVLRERSRNDGIKRMSGEKKEEKQKKKYLTKSGFLLVSHSLRPLDNKKLFVHLDCGSSRWRGDWLGLSLVAQRSHLNENFPPARLF